MTKRNQKNKKTKNKKNQLTPEAPLANLFVGPLSSGLPAGPFLFREDAINNPLTLFFPFSSSLSSLFFLPQSKIPLLRDTRAIVL